MADCRKCKHNYKPSTCEPKCNRMCDGESDFEPITNAMIIRSMGDAELSEFMLDFANDEINVVSNCGSKEYLIKWLQSEAE